MTQTALQDEVHRLGKIVAQHEKRLDALDGSHSRPGPVEGKIKAPITKPKDTWILKPNNRLWISCNMPVFYGDRPGFGRAPLDRNPSATPGFLDHIDLANSTGAGLFLNNIYGKRRPDGHHHDRVWDWWAGDRFTELAPGFFGGLGKYTGEDIHLYLGYKTPDLYIAGQLNDVTPEMVESRWLGQYVPTIQEATGRTVKVEIGVDAMTMRRELWQGIARDICTPRGIRLVCEASWAPPDDPEFFRVPQVFLWQHVGNKGWSLPDFIRPSAEGSVSLWLTNHAWRIESPEAKTNIIRSLWERGYGLVLEYDDLKANIDWLRDHE